MNNQSKETLKLMTPKQAAEWVFYKDPDFVNPFDTGSQQWLEFSDELFFLQVGI
jgi:hypothetical protein